MKKIHLYAIIFAFLFPAMGLQAQQVIGSDIKIEQIQTEKQGDNVKIDMHINLDNLTMRTADMIILTPMLRSADKSNFKRFAPVVLTGARRSRTLARDIDFEGFRFEVEPTQIVRRYNKRVQSVPLTLTTPYESWLRGADLVFIETKSGCDLAVKTDNEYNVFSPVLPILIEPVYSTTYVTPPVEEVKQRSETHTARLNFKVGKYDILPDFENNAEILRDVDKVISELRSDNNLTITEFSIVGYASPEGNEQSNMKLSENRAKSFVSYLTNRYNIPASSIKTDWRGEDWAGLRHSIEASGVSNKSEILAALDEINVAQRKNKIKQVGKNGGVTYRDLLDNYYPQLRRNEYTIAFVAKKFSIEEAKEQIKTKPQYLSLNEMFLVANTYPKTSHEFKEVFDIAVRLYPDNPIAQLNTAALEIENGSLDNAINRLQKINTPEAWNNLGVAYALKGDYQKANEAFNKAVSGGNQTAVNNANQLSEWLSAQ